MLQIFFIFLFVFVGTSRVSADLVPAAVSTFDDCRSVLSGIMTKRTRGGQFDFHSEFTKWISSNKFSSLSSFNKELHSHGLSLAFGPLAGEFNKFRSDARYVNKTWSESLVDYLNSKQHIKTTFYDSLTQANVKVIDAWSQCQKLKALAPRLYCTTSPSADGANVELFLEFVGFGRYKKLEIDKFEVVEGSLDKPQLNNDNKFLFPTVPGRDRVFIFKRPQNVQKTAGRIHVYTVPVGPNNARYNSEIDKGHFNCTSKVDGKFGAVIEDIPGCADMDYEKKICGSYQFPLYHNSTGAGQLRNVTIDGFDSAKRVEIVLSINPDCRGGSCRIGVKIPTIQEANQWKSTEDLQNFGGTLVRSWSTQAATGLDNFVVNVNVISCSSDKGCIFSGAIAVNAQ